MKILVFILLVLSVSIFAQTANKEDISGVLKMMESQGLFKKEDIEQARRDMENMSDDEWAKINTMAKEVTTTNKGIIDFKKKVQSGDMSPPTKAQFQELKEKLKSLEQTSEATDLK